MDMPQEQKYFSSTDQSYVQVANATLATKVWYGGTNYFGGSDHSTITTSTSGYFSSKWGPGPRFKHAIADSPYSTSSLTYYIGQTITGPSSVSCGQTVQYYMPSIPGATYEWSSQTGTMICAYPYPTSNNMATFYMPPPYALPGGGSDIIKCKVNNSVYYYIKGVVIEDCGRSPIKPYPNSASDILNIEIELYKNVRDLNTDPTYNIRLYDEQGNPVRNTTTRSAKMQFNVGNLPNGIYSLHVYDEINSKPEVQQVIVQH